MNKYIETKVKCVRVQEDCTQKKTTEVYLVDALSFSEAENGAATALAPYINGEFEIDAVKKSNISEIIYENAGSKILAKETNDLLNAAKQGTEAASDQLNKKIDWDASNIDTEFYKVKYFIVTLNEKTGKEEKTAFYALVEAVDLSDALNQFGNAMRGTISDFVVDSICKSPIIGVIAHSEDKK